MERQAHTDQVTIAGQAAQHILDVDTISRLTEHGIADRKMIEQLNTQSVVDQEMITTMTEQGLLDKAEIAHLAAALVNARKIGAAIGVVMATNKVSEEAACGVLRDVSQRTHRKLHDVADTVLYTGNVGQQQAPVRPTVLADRPGPTTPAAPHPNTRPSRRCYRGVIEHCRQVNTGSFGRRLTVPSS